MPSKSPAPSTIAGFGLVELLVAMSIMTLVSTVILVNESSFKGAVVLRNQAYELSFMIRQMQLLAVSGPIASGSNPLKFGMQINQDDSTIVAFADVNFNNHFDTGDRVIERRSIDDRFAFTQITHDGTAYDAAQPFHVIFTRPNFDAQASDQNGDPLSSPVRITIGVPGRSEERAIEILSSGNITVLSN